MERKSSEARLLRSYSATAQKYHQCSYCCTEICPGEGYSAQVWADNKYLWVLKRHDNCPVDPDEEYWREKEEREKALENMPQAA